MKQVYHFPRSCADLSVTVFTWTSGYEPDPGFDPIRKCCLHTHTEILTFTSLINISILLSECHTAQTTTIFKGEQHEAAELYCGLSAVQCQHRVAHMAYPPYLEQRQRGQQQILNLCSTLASIRLLPLCKKQEEQRVKIRSCDESSSY